MLRWICLWSAIVLVSLHGANAQEPEKIRKKVVVVDPGHGGVDLGARSPKSLLEKSIAMKIAMAMQSYSSRYQDLEVILTREGDLDRTWLRRQEFANAARSDLFVSLHTGGGFSARARPAEIFIAENRKRAADPGNWDAQNYPFKSANLRFAKLVSAQLAPALSGKEIKIVQTSLLKLEGLAMPALMIEPLDLSNPQDEILAGETGKLETIANAILTASAEFLGVKEAGGRANE